MAGLSVLGNGSHTVVDKLEKLAGKSDGLNRPTDLEFNPDRPDELWIVNKDDDSVTILFGAGTADQTSDHMIDPYALHFMEKVTSISFGKSGHFGTCQDGDNTYNDQSPGNGFTGPTLWSSDLDIFAKSNPEAVDFLTNLFGFYADLGSHLDMLHESPDCMGIAWDKANVYWVFDGYNSSINRYDFQEDHGPGYDDHSDGIIARWVPGEVDRKNGVVSHLILDHDSNLLYIADTGNNRIAVLDTKSGKRGDDLEVWEPGTDHHLWKNGDIQTLVDGDAIGMEAPAGISLMNGKLWVTDNGTGKIHVFDLTGKELDWADTGLGPNALAGIRAVSDTEIWFTDQKKNGVYRITP